MGPDRAVADVRRAVRAAVRHLKPGDLVLVACSGGPDSVALAAALAFEAPRAGLRAGAVTVDHGLQPGSRDRADQVADQMRAMGLDPVDVVTVTVSGPGGPEAAARAARYRALDEAADRRGAAAVLLGHTRDDQAETVLLGLARGSGARSLSGMPPRRGRYRRPLLDLPRDLVRAAAAGHKTWDDPQNVDPSYTRSRVRREVLPVLERALGHSGHRVADALARSARLLRDDADALDHWAEQAATEAAEQSPTNGGLAVTVLAAAPAAVRTRVLRRAALAAGAPSSALTADHVMQLDRLVTDWHGQGPLHLPGGVSAARECDTLTISRPADVPDEEHTR